VNRVVRATILLAPGAVVVAHAWPALTSWPAIRKAATPGLSGIGVSTHVALTFDDGPDPRSTPHVLTVLQERNVRATFFMSGSQAGRTPGLAADVAAAGHEVAVHGFTHRCLLACSPRDTLDDLRHGIDTVARASGTVPRWWRPPYGALTSGGLSAARRCHGCSTIAANADVGWGH
jgi:peptidoglycan/xylan/chitin deacetylase (PgdA/CDA1 family)